MQQAGIYPAHIARFDGKTKPAHARSTQSSVICAPRAIKNCFNGSKKHNFRESPLAGSKIPHNLEMGETG